MLFKVLRQALSLSLLVCSLAMMPLSAANADPLVPHGERHTLNSRILGESHAYTVYLPPHYDALKRYPVLYLLDGDKHAQKLLGAVDSLATGIWPRLPEVIVVGIDNQQRMRDYTPAHTLTLPGGQKGMPAYQQTGGADRFLDYIEKELQPAIEQAYSTRRPNILIGHSFGGLVTLEALRQQRNGFDGYLAIDPSLWFDYPHYVNELKQQLGNRGHNRGGLFIAAANNPLTPGLGLSHLHRDLILDLCKTLKSRAGSTFHVQSKYYPDADHPLVVGPALYDGLRALFAGYRIPYGQQPLNSADVIANYSHLSQRLNVTIKPSRQQLRQQWGYIHLRMKDNAGEEAYRQLLEYYYPDKPATPVSLHGDPSH